MEKGSENEDTAAEELEDKAHSEGDYNHIKTQFVRDRLRKTKWEDRGYINGLMLLEYYVELSMHRQSPGFGGALAYFHLRKRYPVEHECIDREMTQGIRTSFDEFINMQIEHDRAEAQLEIESVERGMREREESIRKEHELRQQWHELGGKS